MGKRREPNFPPISPGRLTPLEALKWVGVATVAGILTLLIWNYSPDLLDVVTTYATSASDLTRGN